MEIFAVSFTVCIDSVRNPNEFRFLLVDGKEDAASEQPGWRSSKVSELPAEELVDGPVELLTFGGTVGAGVAGTAAHRCRVVADRTLGGGGNLSFHGGLFLEE